MRRRVLLFVTGLCLTILGITIVLQQWESVVTVFKAFMGPALAVAGLVILFASSIGQHD
jgi:hypothetical protein